MKITTNPDTLATDIDTLANSRTSRVLVPTMGALHEGHLQLITEAHKHAGTDGCVIVSIFVNPTQFDRAEDLQNYPRTLDSDLEKCRDTGVDLVFAPNPETMYHADHSVNVTENALALRLCGAARPGHFNGVCTVVLKLFNLTRASIAVFGKKDYQQLAVIRRMVRDLHVPVTIEGVETVREPDGLAMSSRNLRLNNEQRSDAARIRRGLLNAATAYRDGTTCADELLSLTRQEIEASTHDATIDYLELLDAETLTPIQQVEKTAVLATAVFYGNVRLIDNIEINA